MATCTETQTYSVRVSEIVTYIKTCVDSLIKENEFKFAIKFTSLRPPQQGQPGQPRSAVVLCRPILSSGCLVVQHPEDCTHDDLRVALHQLNGSTFRCGTNDRRFHVNLDGMLSKKRSLNPRSNIVIYDCRLTYIPTQEELDKQNELVERNNILLRMIDDSDKEIRQNVERLRQLNYFD